MPPDAVAAVVAASPAAVDEMGNAFPAMLHDDCNVRHPDRAEYARQFPAFDFVPGTAAVAAASLATAAAALATTAAAAAAVATAAEAAAALETFVTPAQSDCNFRRRPTVQFGRGMDGAGLEVEGRREGGRKEKGTRVRAIILQSISTNINL